MDSASVQSSATRTFLMKAMADYVGVHYSTVSRAVRRAEGQKTAYGPQSMALVPSGELCG